MYDGKWFNVNGRAGTWIAQSRTAACLTEVPVRRNMLAGLVCIGLTASLWPAELQAQHRRARFRPSVRTAVVVRPVYRPFFRPHLRASFGFGRGFFGQYPYPYPYYGYRFDPRADVHIDGGPPDAEVFVDGYFVGVVDDFDGFAQRLHLEPGYHEITIYHPAYRTWTEQVRLRPRQSLTIPRVLEPLPAGAAPEPRPAPSPAAQAPERGREGYRPAPPAARGALGTVSLRVQPADAEVWIDGERWDWPAGESQLAVDLPEGSHRLEVRREGHRPYSTTIEVRRGEVTNLNVTLQRE